MKISYQCPLEVSPFAQMGIAEEFKREKRKPQDFLRIRTQLTVTEHKMFDMLFDDAISPDDGLYKVGLIRLVLDQETAELLVGSKLEIKDGEYHFIHLNGYNFIDEIIYI